MICNNCIHNAVCERAHFENHCGYKHTEADIVNPELEKIKAELTEYRNNIHAGNDEFHIGRLFGCDETVEIINKRIAELKGENNVL